MPTPVEPSAERRREGTLPPAGFRASVRAMTAASFREEITVESMPAPQRIAPFAAALSAEVEVGAEDVGAGRLVLLHDPAGNDTWGGTYRCVAYVRAEIEAELAADPLVSEVGWSWVVEELDAHAATYSAVSGTVTCVSSVSFGSMAGEAPTAQIEIRASWTPDGDLRDHVEAWGTVLATACGLPPMQEGVRAIPAPRQHRGLAR